MPSNLIQEIMDLLDTNPWTPQTPPRYCISVMGDPDEGPATDFIVTYDNKWYPTLDAAYGALWKNEGVTVDSQPDNVTWTHEGWKIRRHIKVQFAIFEVYGPGSELFGTPKPVWNREAI